MSLAGGHGGNGAPASSPRRARGRRLHWGLATASTTLVALLAMLLVLDRVFPLPLPEASPAMVVLAADGTPLRQWPGADGRWRQPVTPEQVSPLYLQALRGYEDRWFDWHPGVNPAALLRAAWQRWHHGRVVSGGSTLTMQVARLIDPPAPGTRRAWPAKLRQIARALQLEWHLDKRAILTLYLDHAPMGGIVEGVEMASRAYLGKPASDLSPAEAALLAALPQAPSRLRPDRHPQAAEAARNKVLQRMADLRLWTPAQVADARLETVVVPALRAVRLAPLAAQRLRDEAVRADAAAAGDDRASPMLASTIDPTLQWQLENLLLDRAAGLPPKVSIAALVMDNGTLEVRAYAGSADFDDEQRAAHVDMVRGVRSPGSALKPFLYAMALDEGLVHSESLLIDAPQSFGGYAPGNFQASFSGPVSVSEALQRSLNVPAVDLLDRLGPRRFVQGLRAGGLRMRLPAGVEPNLSLILGGGGTTLEELVGAYRALARGGMAGQPRLRPEAPRRESRLMSPGAAFIVRDILEGGGRPDRPFLEAGGRGLAWKTGTSFGFRDAWAVGVTDRHTLGVWVGRPDGTPNPGIFGANTAAPLLQDLARAVGDGRPDGPRLPPASVTAATVCWPLGLRAEATDPGDCRQRRVGWALDGTVPPTLADRQRPGGLLVADACDPDRRRARWPVALEAWVETRASACEDGGSHPSASSAPSLRITGLDDGVVLRPPPGQDAVEVTLGVRGRGTGSGEQEVLWLVDGRMRGRSASGSAWRLRLDEPGRHRITATDGQGRHDHVVVRVDGLVSSSAR